VRFPGYGTGSSGCNVDRDALSTCNMEVGLGALGADYKVDVEYRDAMLDGSGYHPLGREWRDII